MKERMIPLADGRVVTYSELKEMKKSDHKLYRIKNAIVITASSLAIIAALFIIKGSKKGYNTGDKDTYKTVYQLSEEQELETIEVNLNKGETLSQIAHKYFNDNNAEYYGSEDNFISAIASKNGIEDIDKVKPGVIDVPVVIDKNNIYYRGVVDLRNRVSNLEQNQNEYWVDYIVKGGDDLSSIAARASGSVDETYDGLIQQIIKENNLTSTNLQIGQQLKIVNPLMGEYKTRLSVAEDLLKNSLENPNLENNYTK